MQPPLTDRPDELPLCVDMDGTLVNSDTLVELALQLVKQNPLYLFSMILWLFSGKANFKQEIAARAKLDVALLPYNPSLIDWLRQQRSGGRSLILVTGANEDVAHRVAEHLELFDEVIASNAGDNLVGTAKRNFLVERYGYGGYDYVGNSAKDVPVWEASRRAVIVNASASVTADAKGAAEVELEISPQESPVAALIKAMRPHQWSKNLLLFVNIAMAHALADTALLFSTCLAFIAFCLCSSSVYLVNDMLDLEADRAHSDKRLRPFANGAVPLLWGAIAAPLLFVCSVLIASTVGSAFLACLLLYYCVTLSYSFYLKRIVMLDVLILAMLYTLRIIAGASVSVVMPSFWLISFSLFIFTSLAMVKRYSELKAAPPEKESALGGRGYRVHDLPIISTLGAASGFVAILVLALYINSPDVTELYRSEALIWFLCPLLMYWIGRIWLLASRGQLHQDPVVFATTDKISYLILALGVVTLWAAL